MSPLLSCCKRKPLLSSRSNSSFSSSSAMHRISTASFPSISAIFTTTPNSKSQKKKKKTKPVIILWARRRFFFSPNLHLESDGTISSWARTHLREEAFLLRGLPETGEVGLLEEQASAWSRVLTALQGQRHGLTGPLAGQQVTYTQLEEHGHLGAQIPVHCTANGYKEAKCSLMLRRNCL